MAQKAQLLDVVQAGYDEIRYFAALVPPEERLNSGTSINWQPKDLLAHIVEWQLQTAAEMAGSSRRDPDISPGKNDDERNAIIYEKYRAVSWEEILKLLDTAREQLAGQIRALSEEDLNQPDRTEGRPLWREAASNAYLHPLGHLNPEFIRYGDRPHAIQSTEEQGRLMLALDPSGEWQGTVLYNMACGWALMGERQKALDLLEQALRLRPDLLDWSKQDADLESLHGSDEFAALLERAGASHPEDSG